MRKDMAASSSAVTLTLRARVARKAVNVAASWLISTRQLVGMQVWKRIGT